MAYDRLKIREANRANKNLSPAQRRALGDNLPDSSRGKKLLKQDVKNARSARSAAQTGTGRPSSGSRPQVGGYGQRSRNQEDENRANQNLTPGQRRALGGNSPNSKAGQKLLRQDVKNRGAARSAAATGPRSRLVKSGSGSGGWKLQKRNPKTGRWI